MLLMLLTFRAVAPMSMTPSECREALAELAALRTEARGVLERITTVAQKLELRQHAAQREPAAR